MNFVPSKFCSLFTITNSYYTNLKLLLLKRQRWMAVGVDFWSPWFSEKDWVIAETLISSLSMYPDSASAVSFDQRVSISVLQLVSFCFCLYTTIGRETMQCRSVSPVEWNWFLDANLHIIWSIYSHTVLFTLSLSTCHDSIIVPTFQHFQLTFCRAERTSNANNNIKQFFTLY